MIGIHFAELAGLTSWVDTLQETISATSVPTLMKKYNISSFQYAKIDIEGSEYQVFTEKTSKDWISGFDVSLSKYAVLLCKPNWTFSDHQCHISISCL